MITIYKIENRYTKDCYVGSSIVTEARWRRHKNDLRKGKHHSIILQRAWDKYGEDAFSFLVLEQLSSEELAIPREDFYLQLLLPIYNIARNAGSTLGVKASESKKQKHRDYAKKHGIRPPDITWQQKQSPVIMCDYDTHEELQTFPSVSEAGRFLGKADQSAVGAICEAAFGKRYSAYGYKWLWKDENKRVPLRSHFIQPTKSKVLDTSTNIIHNSIEELAISLGKAVTTIYQWRKKDPLRFKLLKDESRNN